MDRDLILIERDLFIGGTDALIYKTGRGSWLTSSDGPDLQEEKLLDVELQLRPSKLSHHGEIPLVFMEILHMTRWYQRVCVCVSARLHPLICVCPLLDIIRHCCSSKKRLEAQMCY